MLKYFSQKCCLNFVSAVKEAEKKQQNNCSNYFSKKKKDFREIYLLNLIFSNEEFNYNVNGITR